MCPSSDSKKAGYIAAIEDAFRSYTANDFSYDTFRAIMEKSVEPLISAGKRVEAFRLVRDGWELGNSLNPDTLPELLDEFHASLYSMLVKILERDCNPELKEEIFAWLTHLVSETTYCFSRETTSPWVLLLTYFPTDEYRVRLYPIADHLAEETDDLEIVRAKFQLMAGLGYSDEEIEKEEHSLSESPAVVERNVVRACAEKDFVRAAELLSGLIHRLEKQPEYIQGSGMGIENNKYLEDLRRLAAIYQECGNMEGRRDCYRRILQHPDMTISDYRMHRMLFTEKVWKTERDLILSNASIGRVNEMLYEDELYDRLMDRLFDNPDILEFRKYERGLAAFNSERVAGWYGHAANHILVYGYADETTSRKAVEMLVRCRKYPSGEKVITHILMEWNKRYRQRAELWKIVAEYGLKKIN